jgi:hypothetical protein
MQQSRRPRLSSSRPKSIGKACTSSPSYRAAPKPLSRNAQRQRQTVKNFVPPCPPLRASGSTPTMAPAQPLAALRLPGKMVFFSCVFVTQVSRKKSATGTRFFGPGRVPGGTGEGEEAHEKTSACAVVGAFENPH